MAVNERNNDNLRIQISHGAQHFEDWPAQNGNQGTVFNPNFAMPSITASEDQYGLATQSSRNAMPAVDTPTTSPSRMSSGGFNGSSYSLTSPYPQIMSSGSISTQPAESTWMAPGIYTSPGTGDTVDASSFAFPHDLFGADSEIDLQMLLEAELERIRHGQV